MTRDTRRELEKKIEDLQRTGGDLSLGDLWRAALIDEHPDTGEELDAEDWPRLWARYQPADDERDTLPEWVVLKAERNRDG